jgi:LytS/YehU family sensor histidine kinase
MVLKLSNLLRYVIYDGKGELVLLQHEIEHIRQFISLFQMKNEKPLDIQFDIDGEISNIKIEPMILIPIVENCFKHCDFDSNEKAFVRIYLKIVNKMLLFQTINTKNNQDLQKDKIGGVGLENIRKRLTLKYLDDFSLLVNNKEKRFEIDLQLKTL